MARKSRKNIDNTPLATEDVIKFSAAIYVRLSREEQEGCRNHASFKNQKAFLLDFVEKHPEITVYKIYEDNGYSGTNFDRPGFSDMMYDVSNEKVDCIIVKDLSRFGREHIETGKYLDYLFPMIGLRFIAVNDNYDTYDKIKDNDMIVPFKNIINAIYSKDISKKVLTSLELKKRKGEYLGTYAPYGYVLDENRHFVVDYDAAKIVQRIFKLYTSGESVLSICKIMMRDKIDCPMNHKRKLGFYKNGKDVGDNLWTDATVRRILTNETYIGNLVQGKKRSAFLETGKKEVVLQPKDKWIIVENTHEPIISKEIFETVQRKLNSNKKSMSKSKNSNVFVGKLFCGECGRALLVASADSKRNKKRYYRCITRRFNHDLCGLNDVIREDDFYSMILSSIKGFISSSLDFDRALTGLKANKEIKLRKQNFEKGIRKLKKELEQNKKQRFDLFEDYVKELIEADEFKFARQTYSETIRSIQDRLDVCQKEYEKFKKMLMPDEWIGKFKKYKSEKNLTKEMVDYFIERITVYKGLKVEITWKFRIEELVNSGDEI